MQKVTAIITARGGSKGVPRKNIRLVDGKPLIGYTIEAALKCPLIDACYVTTEDPEIKQVSLTYGSKVIERPDELAQDNSLSVDAVAHAISKITDMGEMSEYFVLLQPTSPLRNEKHLSKCLEEFFKSDCLCAVSVTEAEHHPWKMLFSSAGKIEPVHSKESLETPRQLLPKAYRINGAIYVMQTKTFLRYKRFFIDPAYPFFMKQEDSLDIDNESDLEELSVILRRKSISQD